MKHVLQHTLSAATISLVGIGAAVVGAPALAQEDQPPAMAMPGTTSWDGAYIGLTYGVGVGGNNTYEPGTIYFPSLEPGQSYGLFAGYNFQNGNMVYGGELAYQRVNTPGFGALGYPAETFEFFLDAKLRGGVAMDNILLYGFAGYSSSAYSVAAPPDTWSVSGANFGVGLDVKAGDSFIIGGELIVRKLSGSTNVVGQVQYATVPEVQVRAGWEF